MRNAEKYLKDGASIEELIFDIINFEKCWNRKDFYKEVKRIKKFFFTSSKPTLTEDERVILRNIKNDDFGKYIGRGDVLNENRPRNFNLYLRGDDEYKAYAIGSMYNHLFQFIKERRRILY